MKRVLSLLFFASLFHVAIAQQPAGGKSHRKGNAAKTDQTNHKTQQQVDETFRSSDKEAREMRKMKRRMRHRARQRSKRHHR